MVRNEIFCVYSNWLSNAMNWIIEATWYRIFNWKYFFSGFWKYCVNFFLSYFIDDKKYNAYLILVTEDKLYFLWKIHFILDALKCLSYLIFYSEAIFMCSWLSSSLLEYPYLLFIWKISPLHFVILFFWDFH